MAGKKEKYIEEFNKNIQTVLSYGNQEFIPVGKFVIQTIIGKEQDYSNELGENDSIGPFSIENFEDFLNGMGAIQIVLVNTEDMNEKIIIPVEDFINICKKGARKNSNILESRKDPKRPYYIPRPEPTRGVASIDEIFNKVQEEITIDPDLVHYPYPAETVSLEECNAIHIINGKEQLGNYSICPIELGLYRDPVAEQAWAVKEEQIRKERQAKEDAEKAKQKEEAQAKKDAEEAKQNAENIAAIKAKEEAEEEQRRNEAAAAEEKARREAEELRKRLLKKYENEREDDDGGPEI